MTVTQHLHAVRRRWLVVVSLVLVGLAAAAAFTWLQTPMYSARVQLFVSVSGTGTDLNQLNQGGTFTQQRVKSYARIVTSPAVTHAVIDKLKLSDTPEELAERITVSSPLDTVLIDISVTDPSPERARDVANALAAEFPRVVDAIETPAGQRTSPVKVSVTEEADLPDSPVSPRVTLNLALGLVAGLALGIGAALVRDRMDRTIRSKSDAEQAAGAPVLAMLGDDPDVRKHPIVADEQFSPRAEAFRQLRTNIRFLSVDRRLSSFVVTGSVEAEGKTTVAANLALALAQAGESVVLVDGDLRRPSVAGLFKLPGTVGLTNVLLGELTLKDALQQWREDLQLLVLSSGPIPPNPSELLGSARLQEVVRTLTDSGWTVIFDSPPLLPVTDAAVIARATGGALLVTRVGSTRTDQLAASVETLHTVDAAVLGIVVNRVPRHRGSASGYYGQRGYAPMAAPVPPGNQPAQTPVPPPRPPVERKNGHAPSPKKVPTARGQRAVPDAISPPPGSTQIPPIAPGTPVRPASDS